MLKKYAISFDFEGEESRLEFISAIRECGFTERISSNLYSIGDTADGIKLILSLQEKLLKKFGTKPHNLKKVVVFLLEEYGDITSLLEAGGAE